MIISINVMFLSI